MGEGLVDWKCDKLGYVHLNSFWGGTAYGRSVQITIGREFVQMSFEDAKTFFREAIRLIEARDEGYDENPPWWETINQGLDSKVKKQ